MDVSGGSVPRVKGGLWDLESVPSLVSFLKFVVSFDCIHHSSIHIR